MKVNEIFANAIKSNYLIIDDEQLNTILSECEILRIENTYLSDFIRLIKFDINLFVQEITFNKEIILRKMNSIEDADNFIKERLDFYERKWDGCGCKIDYYE